jgi:putative ATP-binding cassette transporter
MSRTKRLTFFTQSYAQAAVIFPYILVAPAYFFAGKLQLGGIQQTADAFDKVYRSLSFFVSVYRRLAEWRAVVARLDGFEMSIASSRHLATSPSSVRVTTGGADAIELQKLLVRLPHGEPVVAVDALTLRKGERTLISGPSGAGKSTLFRAIAGIWPFGDGAITIPAGATLMMLPQRPYFPIGSLHAAVVYPSEAGAFSEAQVREVLAAVGLPAFAPRLHEEEHWNRMLSLGEQLRLGLARALLHAPTFLFLDETTASLDEPLEAALYRLLGEKLPATTLVSIGHRSTLEAFHARKLALVRDGDHFAVRDEVPAK